MTTFRAVPGPRTSIKYRFSRLQIVGLEEVSARLQFVAHEHDEHAGGFDGVVDLQAQQVN